MAFAGLDVGTSGSKMLVYDLDGNIIFTASRKYTELGDNGRRELEPETVMKYVKEVLREVGDNCPEKIDAMAVTSLGESVVCLDKNNRALANSMLTGDCRGIPETQEIIDRIGAQKIFETINCTGIKLTTGEMLKNFLFDETKVDEYERTWKQVFENQNNDYWERELTNGRLSGSHIENFFYRYMLIKMQEPEIKKGLTLSETKSYRQIGGQFEKFRNLINKFNISKEDAVKDIVKYAQIYLDIFKPETLDEVCVQYQGIERLAYLMFMQDTWTMTPYILYLIRNVANENERNRIFGYLENYLIRRIICKSKNNNYSDMFSENLIGQQIDTLDAFEYTIERDMKSVHLNRTLSGGI